MALADHPRIRGEHDFARSKTSRRDQSSPHTRGALPDSQRHDPKGEDHPRIRGEHGGPAYSADDPRRSSPHTRGARFRHGQRWPEMGIIPAYAGSTSIFVIGVPFSRDHPRIRGEHTTVYERTIEQEGSSPHTRGALQVHAVGGGVGGIIPAYAGSTRRRQSGSRTAGDHPRIRGEHADSLQPGDIVFGSSPHTRGARSSPMFHRSDGRIIPAYAGSTWIIVTRQAPARDHPRIRGEHGGVHMIVVDGPGSSPHTRGALSTFPPLAGEPGIIPAYAGSTLYSHFGSKGIWDHPRIRGEHPGHADRPASTGGSSPHTRGAPGFSLFPRMESRIIPAYAGSTCGSIKWIPAPWDHPRIRGEHLLDGRGKPRNEGSSPHTRGALHSRARRVQEHGIIPAYAGSTP